MSRAEETLRGQLPEYFRPIIEFREILKAHGYSLDKLDETSEKVKDNNYIATCDEETIAYYEKLLGITYRFGDTMEYRRARVLQKYNTIVPFSIEFLRDKLTELYGEDGYEMSVDSAACKLKIKVTSDRYGAIFMIFCGMLFQRTFRSLPISRQQTVFRAACTQQEPFHGYLYRQFTDIPFMASKRRQIQVERYQAPRFRQYRTNRRKKRWEYIERPL